MWTAKDEAHIINRECVVCVKKMTCKILDPLIAEAAKSFQPKEWNASIVGIAGIVLEKAASCTMFEGNPIIMERRRKREEAIRRQYEKKKATELAMEQAKQVEIKNGHMQEGNVAHEPSTDERPAEAHH